MFAKMNSTELKRVELYRKEYRWDYYIGRKKRRPESFKAFNGLFFNKCGG